MGLTVSVILAMSAILRVDVGMMASVSMSLGVGRVRQ